MATPPFNLDITNPTDTAAENVYPANERAFRDNTRSYINTEHDISSGHHMFPQLSTTARDAIVNWPNGALIYNTSVNALQLNVGTTVSPVWASVFLGNAIVGHVIVASGAYTLTSNSVKVTLVGGGGGGGSGILHASMPCGGGGGAGGGAVICWLVNLTIGNTLTVTVGAGGAGGSSSAGVNGSATSIASGTQTISTRTAGGGGGGPQGVANTNRVAGGTAGTATGVAGDYLNNGQSGGPGFGTSTTGIGGYPGIAGGGSASGTGGFGGYSTTAISADGAPGADGFIIIESING